MPAIVEILSGCTIRRSVSSIASGSGLQNAPPPGRLQLESHRSTLGRPAFKVDIEMIKTIFVTFCVAFTALAVTAALFLQTILAAFGLVATSIETLQGLQASQQVVERMKARHADRKTRASKRFVKRSGKRVATATLAAATVGATGVVIAVTAVEIADYCEEKQELGEDAKILYGTDDEFNFLACADEAKGDVATIWDEARESTVRAVSTAIDSSAQYGTTHWESVKDASQQAYQSSSTLLLNTWVKMRGWFGD